MLEIGMQQPGFIRALVRKGAAATKVEWVHDTAWRLGGVMPEVRD